MESIDLAYLGLVLVAFTGFGVALFLQSLRGNGRR